MRNAKRLVRALWIGIAVAPALAILAALLAWNVDVPWWDEWIAIGGMFEKLSQGTLALLDLTGQHNEHRIFFPKLVCLALGSWGGWDVRRETTVTFLLAVLTAWNVLKLLRQTVGGGETRVWAIFLLANLLIFSPAQWGNWFKGMQMALLVPPLCLTSSLRLALSRRGPWTRIGVPMVLGTVATFSVGNGFLCWILLLPLLLRMPDPSRPSRAKVLAIWTAGFSLNVAMYLYGYRQPENRPPVLFAFEHPLQSLHYFVSFLGSPFAPTFGENQVPAAFVLGAALLVLFLGCCVRSAREGGARLERSLPWMSIGAYSILTAAMTTVARVGVRDDQALASRYVTFSLYLGVGLVGLIGILLESRADEQPSARLRAARGACAGLLAIAAIGTWPESLRLMKEERTLHLQGKACLQFAGVIEDLPGLRILHSRFAGLRNRILQLDRGGFLSPGLVRSRRAQDFCGDPSAECGVLAHFERHGDVFVADGRALLPGRNEAADAILLAYDRNEGDSTVFAVSIVGRLPEVDAAEGGRPWRASFTVSTPPAESASVSAWAFDALSGKAFRLRGASPLR